jgi:exonuclease SbcC
MKILKEIKLINFLSHSKTEIKFKDEQKTLIDGISGAGKSSIVEGLVWCLYGKGRTDNKSLVRHKQEKATVEVIFTDDDNEYKITRSITNKNRHTFKVEELVDKKFQPVKTVGIKGTQDHLERNILKSSYLLFVNSIAYLQNNIESFVKQTAGKRKDIILEIINSDDYDSYLKKAKALLQSKKTELEVNESKIEDRKTSISENKERASMLPSYIKDQNDIKDKIIEKEEYLNKKLSEKEILSKKIAVAEANKRACKEVEDNIVLNNARIETLNKKIIEIQSQDLTSIKKDVEELNNAKELLKKEEEKRDAVMDWTNKMNAIQAELPATHDYEADKVDINRQLIDIMGESVPECPKCGTRYPLFEENKQKRINVLSEKLSALEGDFEAYNAIIDNYKEKAKLLGDKPTFDAVKISELKNKIDILSISEKKLLEAGSSEKMTNEYAEQISLLSDEIVKLIVKKNELFKDIDGIDNEIVLSDIEREIRTTTSAIQGLNSDNAELQGKISLAESAKVNMEKSQKEIDTLLKEVDEQKEDIDCLEIMKDAFGPNGVKSIVIDYVIPQLEERINGILSKLSDFRIRLETQKSGLTEGSILDGLFISVINEMGEESAYDGYSGGEKIKIDMSIFEGLASIQKFGFRFFDESVLGLDEDTIDSFGNVMLQLQEDVNQLFCISHLRSVKDLFNDKITIVKNNGVSKII